MKKKSEKNEPGAGGSRIKKVYSLILVAGLVLVGVYFVKDKNLSLTLPWDDKEESEITAEVDDDSTDVANVKTDHLEGVLYSSDNTSRGNFKLSSQNRDIYIRTTRDYGSLLGLQVLVLINGTVDNFELLDIQPKLEKDGYLLGQ